MADLDHFKAVNDRHGHLVGDEVLKICAARMVAGARADDEVCRYGGEEFLLILDGARLGDAWEVAERVRSRISEDEIHCGDEQIYVTISLGLAEAQASDTANSLIERADAALYAAKSAGRNCIRG
jgi:diguanylate cyclase